MTHLAVSDTPRRFYDEELKLRQAFRYPPFTRLARIVSVSTDRSAALADLTTVSEALAASPDSRSLRLLGPSPAPIEKLQGKFRFHLLVRCENRKLLRAALARALAAAPLAKGGRVGRIVDVDPMSVM